MSRVPKSTFEWFFHEPVIGDLLVLTMTGGVGTCYHEIMRDVQRLPPYPPDVVDAFVRKFDLGYVILRPGMEQGRSCRRSSGSSGRASQAASASTTTNCTSFGRTERRADRARGRGGELIDGGEGSLRRPLRCVVPTDS
jgi:hypothetical protein